MDCLCDDAQRIYDAIKSSLQSRFVFYYVQQVANELCLRTARQLQPNKSTS